VRLLLALFVALAPAAVRAADRVVEPVHPLLSSLEGVTFRSTFSGGQLYLDGKKLDALGRGNYGVVFDHPRAEGVVVKLADHSPEVIMNDPTRTHETTSDLEESAARPLGDAGLGPRYLAKGTIGGRPVSAREKVYGSTLEDLIADRRYGDKEHALVLDLLSRIAESRMFPEDVRTPNIMIGTTLLDPAPRAYVVDSTRLRPVDPAMSAEALREALYRQETTISRRYDPFVGDVVVTKPFNRILEDALGRRKTLPWRQRAAAFLSDLLSHMSSPAP